MYLCFIVCAGAAGDTTTAELMRQRAYEAVNGYRLNTCQGTMCSFTESKEAQVAEALRWTAAASSGDDDADCNHGDGRRHCRLIAYEVLYVKYGVAKWPVDSLHAVLSGEHHHVFRLLQHNNIYILIISPLRVHCV